ncbi:MAG TPA: N-acetylmuramoyl-L-alanine amidase, partial [Saprospiraceae bacterium]|nr:N-acetylmuramoyl-L-alanine amidase [Saprospiraceae bacterium]
QIFAMCYICIFNYFNKNTMKYLITIGIILFSYQFSLADNSEADFFSTTIKDGDGITNVLNRFMLANSKCNVEKFLEINNINANAVLFKHKEYKLPVKIYKYDGKSIRSTIGIADINKALRIQKYNEDLLEKGLRKTNFKDSRILWVPYNEIACENEFSEVSNENVVTSSLSRVNKLMTESLFGEGYKDFELIDNKLENHVYYICSGHGGPDPGAVCDDCPKTMCEDEYAYDVGLRLARNLMQHGAKVYLIIQDLNDGIRDELYLKCDRDERLYDGSEIPISQIPRLEQRASAINQLYLKNKKKGVKVQKAIMIHVDSRSKDKNQDVFFYYYNQNQGGKELVESVFNTFEEKYKYYRKDKEYKGFIEDRNLFMLRKVVPSSIYVELANIRNEFDHKRLIHSYNRQALANWLFEGMTGVK